MRYALSGLLFGLAYVALSSIWNGVNPFAMTEAGFNDISWLATVLGCTLVASIAGCVVETIRWLARKLSRASRTGPASPA